MTSASHIIPTHCTSPTTPSFGSTLSSMRRADTILMLGTGEKIHGIGCCSPESFPMPHGETIVQIPVRATTIRLLVLPTRLYTSVLSAT